ncbi:hypothetical protein [Jiangella mangrovi]|uniref:Gram-positive cocci surface proteins LPxTG domain-containing protein n=1 Tax=Jiangella mangrovi TaxID=1524084 RepID=A0A7W9LLQ4_9ACTN|nr:hypothetical protein [Jiangella mangrovi]MBB5788396.1 hypothetical protein [Jiangella mangrovi]
MTRRTRLLGLLLGPGLLALGPLTGAAAATPAPEVVLEATLEPEIVFAAPGSVVSLEATVTNTGTAEMTGGSADFEVPGDASIVGVEPGDGCEQVSPQRVECQTDATLAAGESATATFEVQLPGNMSETIVGDATLHVAGDNGGEDTVTSQLEVGPHEGYRLVVVPPEGVSGEAGGTAALPVSLANTGSVDIDGASLEVEVPDGATIAGATPDEGCTVVTPQRLECHTAETLVAYDGYYEVTVQVRFDDDAPAGELGVATIRGAGDEGGDDTVDTAEATLTVTAGGGGTETGDGGTDGGTGGGTELPNTGGDELADTGAAQLPVLLAGAVLLAAGGALLLRTRRI